MGGSSEYRRMCELKSGGWRVGVEWAGLDAVTCGLRVTRIVAAHSLGRVLSYMVGNACLELWFVLNYIAGLG